MFLVYRARARRAPRNQVSLAILAIICYTVYYASYNMLYHTMLAIIYVLGARGRSPKSQKLAWLVIRII